MSKLLKKAAIVKTLSLVCSASMVLAACNSGVETVRSFETPTPALDFETVYSGRLMLERGCVVLKIGDAALNESEPHSPRNIAIPLFNRGFAVAASAGGFTITSPTGTMFKSGQLVTGQGGAYPMGKPDPRSAPIPPPPDTSACPGAPYQINTMRALVIGV